MNKLHSIFSWSGLFAILLLILLLSAEKACAQNSRFDGVVQARSGFPAPGALVAVCTHPCTVPSNVSISTPPSPLVALCSSASDATCTQPNPVTADGLGNYGFYVKPGRYDLVYYGSGLTARTNPDQILSCDPTNCTSNTGAFTVPSGSLTQAAIGVGAANFGLFKNSNGHLQTTIGGTGGCFLELNIWCGSTGTFIFGSTPDPNSGSANAGISRLGAASVAVGNGTQGDKSGTITARSYNGRIMCDTFTGADFSVKVIACIAAVVAAGGGIADATGLQGAQVISQEIDVGSHGAAIPVELDLSGNLTASVSITSGSTACGIKLFQYSRLIGGGTGGANQSIIQASTTTPPNVDALVCSESNPVGNGNYVYVANLQVQNLTGVGTYANGIFHVRNTFDNSMYERVVVANFMTGVAVVIEGACCSGTFWNFTINTNNVAGAQPLLIKTNGVGPGTIGMNFIGLSVGHAGAGLNNILINCSPAGGCSNINFFGLYMEPNSTDTSTALVQINGANSVAFHGTTVGGAQAGANTAYIFDLGVASSLRTFVADMTCATGTGNITHFVNDHIHSYTTPVAADGFSCLPRFGFGDLPDIYQGTISLASGTCPGTPALGFAADTLLGICRAASNTMDLVSNGTSQAQVVNGAFKVNTILQLDTAGDSSITGASGIASVGNGGANSSGTIKAAKYQTDTNCAAVGTAASPSVASCGSATAGQFSCATNATGATCVVNTTAVTANSEIFVFESDTTATGTRLGVTCNTSTTVNPATRMLATITAGTSFTINLGTVTTNPACFSYWIVN